MAANMKAGSESAKRQSKRRREMQRRSWRKHAKRALAGGSAMLSLMAAGIVEAAPQGEQVVHGQATFERNGSFTTITASNNTIINFSSFNIGAAETVQFVQPSAMARVLSRIQSAAPTNIDGALLANGRVYIFNPAGVIFGEGAVVNVGALQAAAGNISNADFLNSINHITQINGQVVNYGSIQADTIALIGKQVANYGSIVAENGFVTMVSGDDVLLTEQGGILIAKIETRSISADGTGVENAGTIDASGGTVTLGAGDIYGLAIHNSGLIRATTVNIDGGASGMVHADGVIDASNGTGIGGSVTIGGAEVAMTGSIDVSGSDGGGSVLIGGGFQGGDTDVRNATNTFVSGQINADATGNGDGGTVIVWADGATQFEGTITARGGAAGGDGGFVEVSGGGALGYNGTADLTAANGEGGNLLLDPTDFTISLAATTVTMTFGGGSFTDVVTTPSNLNTGDLGTQLNLSNTLLDTTSGLGGTGNVTFQNNVTWNSASNLSVNADGSITVNLGVTLTNDGPGGVTFTAPNAGVALNGTILLSGGAFQAGDPNGILLGTTFVSGAASAIDTGGGAVNIGATGTATIGGAGIANAGAVDIRGDGGINLDANITTSGQAIRMRNALTLTGNSSASSGAGAGNVTFDSTIDGGFDLSVTAGTGLVTFTGAIGTGTALSSFTVVSAEDVNLANIGTGGAEGVTGNTSVSATYDLFFTGTNYNANQQTYSAGVARHEISGATIWTSSGDLISFAGGAMNMAVGASITINSNGGNVVTQAIAGDGGTAGAVLINAGAGQVTVGQIGDNGAGNSGVASVDITGNAGIIASGSITTDGGIIDLNSTATIQLGGNLDSTDAGTANAAAITLDGNTTLSSSITIRTDGVADAGVTINTLDATTAGVEALTIDAGTGAVNINNNVGNSFALEGFTVQSGTFTTNATGSIATSGATGINVDASGAISTGAVLLSNGNPIVLDSDSTVTVGAAVTAGAGAITFVAGSTGNASDVDLNATVSSSSTVTFRPSLVATGISIGGAGSNAGDMNVDSTSIGNLAEGFSEIVFGSGTQADTIVIQASETWLDSIHLNAGAGEVNVANAIDTTSSADVANVTISGDGNTTTLAANITTEAGAVTINDSVLLNGTPTIDTTNAGAGNGAGVVTITGAIDALNGNADTLSIDATDAGGNANVSLAGAYGTNTVGGSAALTGDLTITGDVIDLAVVSVDTGVIAITGVTRTDLNGATYNTTTSGAITFTGSVSVVVAGATITTTGGSAATFTGAVSGLVGTETLSVNTSGGNGTTDFQAAANVSGLGSFTVNAGTGQVNLRNVTSIDGSIMITGGDGAAVGTDIDLFGTTITSTGTGGGDLIHFSGDVALGADVVITGAGGAGDDISFAGGPMNMAAGASITINSNGGNVVTQAIAGVGGTAGAVLINAGAGQVTVGQIGDNGAGSSGVASVVITGDAGIVASGSITTDGGIIDLNSTATIQLGGNLDSTDAGTANAAAITLDGNTTLSSSITIRTDGVADAGVTINTLDATTAGVEALTIDAGTGAVNINNNVGNSFALEGFTVESGTFTTNATGSIATSGVTGINIDASGAISTGAVLLSNGNPIVLDSDSTLTVGAAVTAGAGAITLVSGSTGTASDIDLNAAVSGSSTITFRPSLVATGISIGGAGSNAGDMNVDSTSIGNLAEGFSEIVFGSGTQADTIVVQASETWLDSIHLNAGAGEVNVANAIDTTSSADVANVTISGDGNTTTLAANITTEAGAVTINDSVLLNGTPTIDTTNAGAGNGAGVVTITGAIDGVNGNADTLTIDATDGGGNANVSLAGAYGTNTVGGSAALTGDLTITGDVIDLAVVSVDTGVIAVTGVTRIDLNGATYNTTTSGAITFTGSVSVVVAGATITTTGGSAATFTGAVSGLVGTETLSVNTTGGNGTIDFQAAANVSGLGSFTVNAGTGQVNLRNVTDIDGSILITGGDGAPGGNNIDLFGTTITSTGTGGADLISFIGDVALNGFMVITSAGGAGDDIDFSTIVEGPLFVHTVAGPNGDVTFNAGVGGNTPVLSFYVESAENVIIQGVVTSGGGIWVGNSSVDRPTLLTLNGDLTSHSGGSAGKIGLHADDIVLEAAGGAAGTITMDSNGTADKTIIISTDATSLRSSTAWEDGLTLDAGTSTIDISGATLAQLDHLDITAASGIFGVLTLGDGVGNGGVGLDLNTTGNVTFTGDVSTAGDSSNDAGAIDFTGIGGSIILDDVNGDSNISITTDVSGTDAVITIGVPIEGTSAGAEGLTIDAGIEDVTLSTTIGTGTRIGALSVSGNDLDIDGAIEATSITMVGRQNGFDGDQIDLAAVAFDANGGNMSFATDDMVIAGGATLLSTGGGTSVTFTSELAGGAIAVGSAAVGLVGLSEAELQTVQSSFVEIIIGRDTTQAGTIDVNDAGGLTGLNTGLRLRAEMGDIDINSAIDLTNDAGAAFTIEGQGDTTLLSGDITTDGGDITINDTIEVNGTPTLDSGNGGASATAGNITITGNIGADGGANDTLTLTANGATDGNVDVQGNVGSGTVNGGAANDLIGFTVVGAQVDLANVDVDGGGNTGMLITGTTDIDLNGTTYQIVNPAGGNDPITFTGGVTLNADVAVTGSGIGGAAVTFTSTIDSEGGARSLIVQSAATTADFQGAIGAVSALTNLTVNNAAGAGVINLANIGGGAAGVTGGITIGNAATADLNFNGTIYNANAQTYTATAGLNLDVLGGGAPVAFTAAGTSNPIVFLIGTIELGNGANLTVTTGGGGIWAFRGIRGTSDETVVLSATGGVTNTVDVGQIGNANEILQVNITGTSGVTLRGDITTSVTGGTGVSIVGDATITPDLTINTSAGNDVIDIDAITGDTPGTGRDLTLNAGTSTVTVGTIGTNAAADTINLLVITGTGGITLNGSVSTGEDGGGVDGDVDINGAVTLGADVVVDTTDAGGGQAGNLDFSTTINSDGTSRSLTVTTTGDNATFNGNIGTTAALSSFVVTDAAVVTLQNIDTNAAAPAGILIGSNSVVTQIIIGSTLDATDGDAAANAGDITLNSTNIDIVTATTLDVDDDAGTDGTITVGTGAGDTFDVTNAGTGNRGLTINVGTGTLTFHSDLGAFNDGDDGFGNLTVTNAVGGTMTWNGDITTNGGNVDFTGLNTAVVVTGNDGGAWDITTNTANAALGGDIDFGVNAGAAITANAVNLNFNATDTASGLDDGDVRLPTTVTLTTGNLDVDGETITVSAITTGGGNVDLNADASDVDPGGDDIIFTGTLIDTTNGGTTGAGTIALTSGGSDDTMLLSANLTLRTAGAGNDDESVTIGLQLDAASGQTLTINADDGSGDGDGDVDINAAIGTAGGGELGLIQIDGDQVTLGGAIEAAGIRVTGQTSIDIDAAVALDIRGVESYFESASIDNSGGGTITDAVGGGGSIMIYRPLTAGTQFDVGDNAAGSDVSDAAVTAVQPQVGQLQLGHDTGQVDAVADQSGTINIDGAAGTGLVVNTSLIIQADLATVNVTDGIDADANAGQSITVNGSGATTNILNTQSWLADGGGQIIVNDNVVLANGVTWTLDTDSNNDGNGNQLSIHGSIQGTGGGGDENLVAHAGNGNIVLGLDGTDVINGGGANDFGDLTLDSTGVVIILASVDGDRILIGQTDVPVLVNINNPVDLDNGAAGDVLDITATNVVFESDADIITGTSGNVDINGTGAGSVTMPNTAAAQHDLDGSFDIDANFGGGVSLGESIRTSGDAIGIGSDTTLLAGVVLDTTNGAAAGNTVTLTSVTGTLAGAQALTIDGGTGGVVTISGLIGATRLGLLDVREAAAVSFSNNTAATHQVSGLNIGVTDAAVDTISILDDVDSTTFEVQMTADAVSGNVISIQGVDSNGQDQIYTSADDILFGGGAESIESTGNGGDLMIRGTTVGTALGLGTDATSGTAGAGSGVNLTDASIAAIGPGFDGSTIIFGTTGQTALVTIEGASHSYDQNVKVFADGGANVNIFGNLDTVEGNADGKEFRITGAAGTDITLTANLTTDGGQVIFTAGQLFIDGGATRTINTGGDNQSAATGGVVDLDGLTDIDGVTSAGRWDILTEGATNGGNVTLAAVVAAGTGINRIDIDTSGTTAGTVSLNDVRLVYSGAASQFNINDNDATPGNVIVSSTIDLSSSTNDQPGGTFDAGVSDIIPATDGATLTINTSYTGASDVDANEDGGDVILGDITSNGAGVYFDTITIDMSTTDVGSTAGTLRFGGVSTAEQADSVIQADGDVIAVAGTPNANNQTEATILINGFLDLPSNSLGIDTNIEDAGIASGAIDIRNLITDGAANLTLDTSGANNATSAGHVYMGDMGATTPLLSLTVDTRGTVTSGTLLIFDSDASGTAVVNVDGSGGIDFSNAPRIELQEDTSLDTDAAGGVTSAGTLDFNNGGTLDGDDQYDLTIDTTADGGGTDAALTVDSNLGGPTAAGTEELQDLIVSAATITISDVVNTEGFQRWSSSSAATININGNINSDTDDTGDDFEMQSVGNIIQGDGFTIDVNSGAARIQSTSGSITIDGGGNGGLTGSGANQALPNVLGGGGAVSNPRTNDGAPGVVYQLEAATDVTTGDITSTNGGAVNAEVIAGSDGAGGDTGGGATATMNLNRIDLQGGGIVYLQATNTASNGQIVDNNNDSGADSNNITATELHARANDLIGMVANDQVYLDPEDGTYNGDALETAIDNVVVVTTDLDSDIAIDNTDTGAGLTVETLVAGGVNAASGWVRNSTTLDISALGDFSAAGEAVDRLGFIASSGDLTIVAPAGGNSTYAMNAAGTEAAGPTLKLEALGAGSDVIGTGGAVGDTLTVTTSNFVLKSGQTEHVISTVQRMDALVSGTNNDLLIDEADGIDFRDLDTNPTALSSGDALEIRTNRTTPGGTTNTDFNDITQTTAAGDGITLGDSLTGVAVPAGGLRVTVLDTDGGADAAQFGDLRFGVDATASVDIFGTNGTTAIEIDVADGHALFGAASVTVSGLGAVTAIGGGASLDMDANNGDVLIRITASDGLFGSADERQVVFGDSTGVSDVSITAGSSGAGSGNLYVDNDNNLATNPPDGTGAAGANAGGITVSDDASVEALLNGPPNTATGALTFKGDINNDGTVSPDSTRTIIFEGGSADIIIGVAGLTASSDFTLIPGVGFDVIILDGGFIDVNEDPGITAGNLTIRDAENVDMQGDNSRITVDGGVDIGHGAITPGAAGTVTGDIRLNNISIDINGNGDGGVPGGVTPGLFAHTTGASFGLAGAGIRGGAIEGIIILDGVNDLNSNFGAGFLHNLTLQADVGDVIGGSNNSILGVNEVQINAENGVGYDSVGAAVATLNFEARDFVTVTTDGPGEIHINNTPSGDVTIREFLIDQDDNDAAALTNEIYYEQNGFDLDIGRPGLGDTGINSDGGLITVDPPVDVAVGAAIVSGGGAVLIEASNDIDFDAGGTVTSGGGQVNVQAGGNIDFNIGSGATTISSGGGTVFVQADFEVIAGSQNAAGTVTFNVAGTANAVIEAGAGNVTVSGENIVLHDFTTETTGDTFLSAGQLVTSMGTITGPAANSIADITTGGLDIQVINTGGGDVVGTALIPIDFVATGAVTGGEPIGIDGNVFLDSVSGTFTTGNLIASGTQTLTSAGTFAVGQVQGTVISIDSDTDITDADTGTDGGFIGSTSVSLESDTGIGATGEAGSVEIDTPILTVANNTGGGGIFLNSVGTAAINFTDVDSDGVGAVELRALSAATMTNVDVADGNLTVIVTEAPLTSLGAALDDVGNGDDTIALTATEATGDITFGAMTNNSILTFTADAGDDFDLAGDFASTSATTVTITAVDDVTFNGSFVAASAALTVNSSDTTTTLNNATVTANTGVFNNTTVLGTDVTFTGTSFTFNGTLDATGVGLQGATFAGATNAEFNDVVGGATALDFLIVGGTTAINTTGISTDSAGGSGAQTYSGAVVLGSDAVLTISGAAAGDLTFGQTLDSDAVAVWDLTVNLTDPANGSDLIFVGAVGGINPLASLTVDDNGDGAAATGGGHVLVQGGLIETTGSQIYDYPVVVDNNGAVTTFSTIADNAGGGTDLIDFRTTLDGTTALGDSVDLFVGNGSIEFGDPVDGAADDVGGTTPLGNLRIVKGTAGAVVNVNFYATVSANTIYQEDGDGLTRFFDDVMIHTQLAPADVPAEVLTDEGILIRNANIRFDGDVDTQGIINAAVGDDTAGMTVEHEGTLDINDDADANTVNGTAFSGTNFMLGGSFTQREGTDAATVTTEGNIFTLGNTAADTVTFNSPVTLTNDSADDVIVDTTSNGTNATGANISFLDAGIADTSAILGSARRVNDLVLNAGSAGDILVDSSVGEDFPQTGAVALGDILVLTANDVTFDNNVYANRVQIGADTLAISPLAGVAAAPVTGNVSIGEDEGNPGILSTAGLAGSGEDGGIGGIGVDIRADLQITVTEVDTSGGTGASPGGDAGSVTMISTDRGINIGHSEDIGSGDISASGGDAGAGGGGGAGGAGGAVVLELINAIDQGAGSAHLNDIQVTRIDADGGDASGSDVGGASGSVSLSSVTAAGPPAGSDNAIINVAGAITANGGEGEGTGDGAAGGSIDVTSTGASGDVTLADSVTAVGGAANGSGTGGTGGEVDITTTGSSADIFIDGAVSSSGGDSTGGDGGEGGDIDIDTDGDAASIDINESISVNGGSGGAAGGDAGDVDIDTDLIDSTITIDGTITANGGSGGTDDGGRGGTIELDTDGVRSTITFTSSAPLTADGGTGDAGGDGGDIDIDSAADDSHIRIDSTISASGGDADGSVGDGGDGGDVSVVGDADGAGDGLADNVNVSVSDISADGGDSSGGDGGDGGEIVLQAAAGVTVEPTFGRYGVPDGILVLRGDLSAVGGTGSGDPTTLGGGGDIDINNTLPRPGNIGVASIVGAESGTLTIDHSGVSGSGSTTFGEYEAFTSIGLSFSGSLVPTSDVTSGDGGVLFMSNGGTLTFSDMTIDGSLRVFGDTVPGDGAGAVVMFNTVPGPGGIQNDRNNTGDGVFNTNDVLIDQGQDIVVRDSLMFRNVTFGTPTAIGGGDANVDPQFALRDPNEFSLNLIDAGYVVRILPTFRGLFGPSSQVLDHRAELPSITNVAPTFAFDPPAEDWWFQVGDAISPTQAQIDDLQAMGINAVGQPSAQLGLNVFDDLPQSLDPQEADYTVSAGRMVYDSVENALKVHQRLMSQESVSGSDLSLMVEALIDTGLTRRELVNATEALINDFQIRGVVAEQVVDTALTPPVVEIEVEDVEDGELDAPADDEHTHE